MGQIIKISSKKIKPSQDFLKENTVKFILTCCFEERRDKLPPAPIVRYDAINDEYIAIDGHNLLAVKDLFGEECEVFVAENANDKLTTSEFPESSQDGLMSRNKDLAEKFDGITDDYRKLSGNGLDSFVTLRKKYPYLVNENEASKYYSVHREEFIKNYL